MTVIRFCERCGTTLEPDFPFRLCGACKALAREEAGADSPGDPGNRVTLWFVLIVAGVSLLGLLGYYAVVSILAGAD